MVGHNVAKHGFTLIELLVVIAVIALLASILLPSLQQAKLLAQKVACASNMHSIGVGLNLYYSEHDDAMPPSRVGLPNPDVYWYDFIAPYIGDHVDSDGRMRSALLGRGMLVCPTKTEDSFTGEDMWPEGDGHWASAAKTDYLINRDLSPYYPNKIDGAIYGEDQLCPSLNVLSEPSRTLMLTDGMGWAYGGVIGELFRSIPTSSYVSVRYRHLDGANVLMADSHVEYQDDIASGLDVAYQCESGNWWNTWDIKLWK